MSKPENDVKTVTIKVFPEIGIGTYTITLQIPTISINTVGIKECIEAWIDDNLKNVQEWKLLIE